MQEPPLPPGFIEGILVQGRREKRRRRLTLAALALVLLALPALILPTVTATVNEPADAKPSLPDEIADFSLLTRSVSEHPAGRAIMIYVYGNGELFNQWQPLALGADGDTYRRIDAAAGLAGTKPWLLSPDGTTILLAEETKATESFTRIDLTTGQTSRVGLPAPTGVVPLAMSPDGRYVAYTSVTPPDDKAHGAIQQAAFRHGTMALLDLTTGQVRTVPDLSPVQAASFSPDGKTVAVQSAMKTWLVDVDDFRREEVAMPDGQGIAPRVAWSPDGRRLATVTWTFDRWTTLDNQGARSYRRDYEDLRVGIVDLAGATAPIQLAEGMVHVLGWRSPQSLVGTTEWSGGALTEYHLDGRAPEVISRFDTGRDCEFWTQPCVAIDVQLATGLLAQSEIRDAGWAQRGPWPLWAYLTVGMIVSPLALILWRRMRRKPQLEPIENATHSKL